MTDPPRDLPRATVVVCVYTEKRWDDILAAVDSVQAQDVPATEILVVVDHNTALLEKARDVLGPRGVRVNGLLPGRIGTDRVAELDASTGDAVAAKAEAVAAIPLGRYGEPEEFGRAAAFLLSPAASFVNGVMLPVDGGMLRAL